MASGITGTVVGQADSARSATNIPRSAPPAPVRQQTQIEALIEQFARASGQLSLFNDNLEQKLEMFAPSRAEKEPTSLDEAQPPNGTYAALDYQARRFNKEVNRYGALVERLAEII